MEIQLMDVKRQYEVHEKEYEEAVLKVLRSGRYIGGEEVIEFEKEFAEYEGARFGVSCGNGTDAIILALRALGIGKGDEVITVSWTFFATAESIESVGATPVFVDVCEDTYCMNPDLVEDVITPKTKAILPVHFYGQCSEMSKLREICDKYKLYLIADCAQATGTKYDGERRNILGDVSCFSFFPTKVLGCAGDGGMVLTDDERIAKACRALRVHGAGMDALSTLEHEFEVRGEKMPSDMPIGKSKYYNYLIGYNSRLDAIQAAILRQKLKYMDEFLSGRRKNASIYNAAFEGTVYETPFVDARCEHAYYIYALRHERALEIVERLRAKGISCGTYYPLPLHLQGAFMHLGYKEGDFPVTESLSKTTFAIPVFSELQDVERNYIITQTKQALEEL